ncbi:cupin domain-containing protein [Gaiella sp.]|uniref:cupin domain-containing protein n=1 Tax=Gaiella sp. TaxID=2663207 RepID=UPI002E37E999|nr:cupin domain-containing protein [Gaiella sp.]HEX5584659.1 cupin domain-containing protein [Gaiella sp.]
MLPESPLEETDHGLVPTGKGWFVLNARDAPWWERGGRGFLCEFEDPEGDRSDFSQVGVNITVLPPGEVIAMYHWEVDQEDFLVLAGEAVLVVEGEERRLRPWDLVHCPPRTEHVIVGAGTTPCVVVAVGARVGSTGPAWGGYTVDETALRHGAGVERETTVPDEAYARFPKSTLTSYPEGLLGD